MKLSKLIKSVIGLNLISLALVAASAQGSTQIPYYGDGFYVALADGTSDLKLQMILQEVLEGTHMQRDGQNDLIADSCKSKEGRCYEQFVVGYKKARNFITTDYYLRQLADGTYVVTDVYCATGKPASRTGGAKVNVEHTWPQSKFSRAYPNDMQKSDLHHLYPTDPNVNRIRGNHPFGEVQTETEHLACKGPRFGIGSSGSEDIFEPPQNHKGNVARALFYFATRYKLSIYKAEEDVLRRWHQEDPVDQDERDRNEEIFTLQNNRNPFIDFPELVERISDF